MTAKGRSPRADTLFTTLRRRTRLAHTEPTSLASLADALASDVGATFEELTGACAVTMVPVPGIAGAAETLLMSGHQPLCEQCGTPAQIQQRWHRHLRDLRRRPRTHWHRCDRGYLCGVVPVVVKGRALAACRVVCGSDEDEREFEQRLELLRTLVETYVANNAARLAELLDQATAARTCAQDPADRKTVDATVQRAIAYVSAHLADPTLTVARTAKAVELNSAYLGHIFVTQVGLPLHRFIVRARIDLAKQMLVETTWQVKRIARETGHGNADWFSHVFHRETGLTPREYRRQHLAPGRGERASTLPAEDGAASSR